MRNSPELSRPKTRPELVIILGVEAPARQDARSAHARRELQRTLDAIDGLPIEYREPLLLAASRVSCDEIASMLGIAVGTVKIQVHRARLKLTGGHT